MLPLRATWLQIRRFRTQRIIRIPFRKTSTTTCFQAEGMIPIQRIDWASSSCSACRHTQTTSCQRLSSMELWTHQRVLAQTHNRSASRTTGSAGFVNLHLDKLDPNAPDLASIMTLDAKPYDCALPAVAAPTVVAP